MSIVYYTLGVCTTLFFLIFSECFIIYFYFTPESETSVHSTCKPETLFVKILTVYLLHSITTNYCTVLYIYVHVSYHWNFCKRTDIFNELAV